MSLITAADLPDSKMVSVVIPGIHSDYANHSPLSVLDVTQGGQAFEIHIYRGKLFHDDEGESFTPLGYLTLQEYFTLRRMLGGVDENGNEVERTLPMEWSEIDAMIIQMREEALNEQEVYPEPTPIIGSDG